MKSTYRSRCVRRTPSPAVDDITAWARDLVARPGRYGATERERQIVRSLLGQVVQR